MEVIFIMAKFTRNKIILFLEFKHSICAVYKTSEAILHDFDKYNLAHGNYDYLKKTVERMYIFFLMKNFKDFLSRLIFILKQPIRLDSLLFCLHYLDFYIILAQDVKKHAYLKPGMFIWTWDI